MNEVTGLPTTVPSAEESFRAQLARLDELIIDDPMHQLDAITLGECKGVVADVMKDLQAHPELDSILADKDVRNIILFVKQTKSVFESNIVQKQVTRQKKATTTRTMGAGANVMLGAMAKLGFGSAVKALPAPAAESKGPTADETADAFSVLPGGGAEQVAQVSQTEAAKTPLPPVNDPLAALRERFGKK